MDEIWGSSKATMLKRWTRLYTTVRENHSRVRYLHDGIIDARTKVGYVRLDADELLFFSYLPSL